MCQEDGEVLEVDVPWRGQMTYLGRLGHQRKLQFFKKMNFIKDNFQRFLQEFKSTSHWLLEVYISYLTQKMYVSEHASKT